MNRQIRLLGVILAVMLFALLINLSVQQVLLANSTKARSGNSRTLLEEYSRERGPILVQASQVAKSVPTDDSLKYLRVYSNGPLYAPATGFYSMVYGATGIERAENSVLNGTGPEFFVDRLGQLFGGQQVRGGTVTLTLDPAAQQAAADGLGSSVGSVTAIDPRTGAILAMAQSPSFDPNLLSSHDPKAITAYYESLEADPIQPLLNRPLVSTPPPGSTFKLVTSAAALASGMTPETQLPGPATYPLPGSSASIPNWFPGACGPNNTVTLQQALAESCNTAFAYLGNELGNDALRAQADSFGFNTSFEVPLVAATSRYPDGLDASQTAQSAVGQFNVTASTLQMAMVGAAIGNTGLTMNPYLVADKRSADLMPDFFDRSADRLHRDHNPQHGRDDPETGKPVGGFGDRSDRGVVLAFEDADLLVINKPAGLVVHPAPGHDSGTLVNALLHHCRDLAGIGGALRPGIVHRLDRDTSGCLVVAKNDATSQALTEQFRNREVKKTYLALVWGTPRPAAGTIHTRIGRHPLHRKKMTSLPLHGNIVRARFDDDEDDEERTPFGREAITHFRVEKNLGPVSLLRVNIETGRTHQIRVHLAHHRHPVVGDTTYGRARATVLPASVTRQMLHAAELTFTHPRTGERTTLTAPLPADFQTLLDALAEAEKKP